MGNNNNSAKEDGGGKNTTHTNLNWLFMAFNQKCVWIKRREVNDIELYGHAMPVISSQSQNSPLMCMLCWASIWPMFVIPDKYLADQTTYCVSIVTLFRFILFDSWRYTYHIHWSSSSIKNLEFFYSLCHIYNIVVI